MSDLRAFIMWGIATGALLVLGIRPTNDWSKLAIVVLGTFYGSTVGLGIAQNMKCKRCGVRGADCECGCDQ